MEEKTLIEQLKEKLHNGEAKFKYKKKNGEERDARGTLKSDIYGAENEPKGTGRPIIHQRKLNISRITCASIVKA